MSIAPVLSYQMTPCPDPERGCGSIATYRWGPSGATKKPDATPPATAQNPDQTETKGIWSSIPMGYETGPSGQEGDDTVGFGDLVDIVNPLQHLPVVGWAYRHLTGDTIKPVPAMIGGAVFGGGLGLLSSAVQLALQENEHASTSLVLNNQGQASGQRSPSAHAMTIVPPTTSQTGDQLAAATPTYRAFGNREQTAGRIAVYA